MDEPDKGQTPEGPAATKVQGPPPPGGDGAAKDLAALQGQMKELSAKYEQQVAELKRALAEQKLDAATHRTKAKTVEEQLAEIHQKLAESEERRRLADLKSALFPQLRDESRIELAMELLKGKRKDLIGEDGTSVNVDALLEGYPALKPPPPEPPPPPTPPGSAPIKGANPPMLVTAADLEKAAASGNRGAISAAFNARLDMLKKERDEQRGQMPPR